MKKYYSFFVFLLFFGSFVFAQDYDPVLKEGAFWDTRSWSGGSSCSTYSRLQIDGEIMLNGTIYKTLKTAPLRDVNNQLNCVTGELHVNDEDFTMVSSTYLREDTDERKVYIYTNAFTGNFQEYTLCDFSLEIGDPMTNYYSSTDSFPLTVTNISTNAENRKVYQMSDGSSFIEGIGKNEGNTSDYHTLVDNLFFENYCHGDANNQNNCAQVLSISDYKLQLIRIFPNPTSDNIFFTNLENNTFKLYSMLGKEMSFQFSQSTQQMDISHLQQGIYLLEIQGENSAKRILKILKY